MVTAQCSITIYSLVACARTLAQVDLYINVFTHGSVLRPCFCVQVWTCVCAFVSMCERVWTCVYDEAYFWCCCVWCCDGDQYDAVCVTSAPRRARRPMVGVGRLARKTKRRTRSAGFHLSLALVVGPFSFFVFVFVLLFLKYIHTYIFIFILIVFNRNNILLYHTHI